MVKNLPATVGDAENTGLTPGLGRSPGVGNPLHIVTWAIPQTEEPDGLQSMGWQRV